MRSWKKVWRMTLALSLMAGVMTISSFAADRKKINSVTVEVESTIEVGSNYGDEDIEIEIRGKNYSYDHYEIENFGSEWMEEDVPEITIYLRADEGYYFALTSASSLKLTGATHVRTSRQDSSETLALRVKLLPMAERLGSETEVKLTTSGLATWDEVHGAGIYELRFYRNGERIGASGQSTDQLSYDYSAQMTMPGSYYVKVRAINKHDKTDKGEWMESEEVTISEEMAATHKATAEEPSIKGEWKIDGDRLWYRHGDGTYTSGGWELIDEKWYLFDEEGYVRTGWVEWKGEWYYCKDENGEMLTNTTTPDGYLLDHEGHIITQ